MCGRRDDELFRHRACCRLVLPADGLFGATALVGVAEDAAAEADIERCIHVDAESIHTAKSFVVEREDAFDDDNLRRLYRFRTVRHPGVACKVVYGTINRLTAQQRVEVFDEKRLFEGIGVVEVLLSASLERQIAEVAVVKVERQKCCMKLARQLTGKR